MMLLVLGFCRECARGRESQGHRKREASSTLVHGFSFTIFDIHIVEDRAVP
jgi:hypothetical protein